MPKKPRRLLTWQRTDLPSKPRDDYTGLDLDRPQLFARVYFSTVASDRRWFWVLAETLTIATGNEATLEEAVDAAERAYATWRRSEPRT